MKIFKISQINEQLKLFDNISFDFAIYDYHNMYNENINDILNEFVNDKPNVSWNPVSVTRLKPVYRHFMTRGFLDDRDIKSIHDVLMDVINNVARLDASTQLCGHSSYLPDEIIDFGFDKETWFENEKFFDFIMVDGKDPISDYGLPQLLEIIERIPQETKNPAKLLVSLNQILDVIHQRNDLASFLIEGGSDTLMELSKMDV
jgi:hypothetical protein